MRTARAHMGNTSKRTRRRREGGAGTPPKKTRLGQMCDRLIADPQDPQLRTLIAHALSMKYGSITPEQRVALVLAGLRDDPDAAAAYAQQAQHDSTLMPQPSHAVVQSQMQSHPWALRSQHALTPAQRDFVRTAIMSLRRGHSPALPQASSVLSLYDLKTAASRLGIVNPPGHKGHRATWINAIREDESVVLPKEIVLSILEQLTPSRHMSGPAGLAILPPAAPPPPLGSLCPWCKKPQAQHDEADADFCESKIDKYRY
jgi:hypothetical protein